MQSKYVQQSPEEVIIGTEVILSLTPKTGSVSVGEPVVAFAHEVQEFCVVERDNRNVMVWDPELANGQSYMCMHCC